MTDQQLTTTQNIEAELKGASRKFGSMRTNDKLKAAREVSFIMDHIQRNPQLADCTPESLQQAFLQAAAFGLTFNPMLQYCYLIPRYERAKKQDETWPDFKRQVRRIAYATPSYRGLLNRAMASNTIQFFHSDVVYKQDAYRYRGTDQEPLHEYDVTRPRGNVVGAYCFIQLLNGKYKTEWMSVEQIEKARKQSEFPDSLMWKQFYEEGCKKTVIRRAWKTWPTGLQEVLAPIMEVMNTYEGIVNKDDEVQVVIGEEGAMKLHAMLTDQGLESNDADRWLQRFAQTEGIADIHNLPINKLDDATLFLESKLDTRPKDQA